MIAIIDYGAGNVRSVEKALEKIGQKACVSQEKSVLDASDALILPGVGSFGKAMESLQELDLVNCLKENIRQGKPFLGICLGMQMLFDRSYEDGVWPGLSFLPGEIRRFEPGQKVPHMGWNELIQDRPDPIAQEVSSGEYVYFVHSYYAVPENPQDVIFHADYGVAVPAVVGRGRVWGMQFHPEKSGETGIRLLKNFGELIS